KLKGSLASIRGFPLSLAIGGFYLYRANYRVRTVFVVLMCCGLCIGRFAVTSFDLVADNLGVIDLASYRSADFALHLIRHFYVKHLADTTRLGRLILFELHGRFTISCSFPLRMTVCKPDIHRPDDIVAAVSTVLVRSGLGVARSIIAPCNSI